MPLSNRSSGLLVVFQGETLTADRFYNEAVILVCLG